MAIARVDGATNTGSGTTATGTLPSYSAGDCLVATVTSVGAAPSAPAGWTSQTEAWQTSSIAIYTKIAGSESAPTWTVSSGAWTVIISSYSGVDNTTPVRSADLNDSGFSDNATVTLTGVVVDDGIVVAAFAQGQGSYTATVAGLTVRHTVANSAPDSTVYADGLATSSGTVGYTVAWSGFTFVAVVGVALIPATGGGGGATSLPPASFRMPFAILAR
jgi:hypothetical protein